jgi:hypothetical protein
MADRKASVALELRAGQFKSEADITKAKVESLDRSVEELDRDITKIPPDATRAATALKLLGSDADGAGKKLANLGDKYTSLSILDARIKTTRAEVRKLADEFVRTGDVDVFRKLGDSQGLLTALTSTRKAVAKSIEGGVSDAASSPQLRQVGMALGAALAVPLMAALGGALAAGAGAGVAGLGIAAAVLGDPEKFGFAWNQVLRQLKSDFIDAGKPFAGETYGLLARIGPMVAGWHLGEIFRDAVKYVEPLSRGAEDFATNMVRGVGELVKKGEPAVTALSHAMSRLGEAGRHAMEDIAEGADGGAMALHDASNAVALIVEGFGKAVQGAENLYGWIREHPFSAAVATGGLSIPISIWTAFDDQIGVLSTTEYGLQKAAEAAGHAFNQQGDDLTLLTQKMNMATLTTDTLAASMVNKLFSATMALDQATLGYAQSLTLVSESITKKDHSIDISTAKGQENREVVLSAVTANMQLYQSNVAAGMSAQDATAAYEANTAKLEKQLRQAGLTAAEIEGLTGKYRGIPREVNTQIAVEGLSRAISQLNETLRLINGLHDKTVTVTYRTRGQSMNAPLARGGIRRAAVGMVIPPSDPGTTLVGEPQTGGEALIPLKGISQSRAMGLAQTVGNAYGFSVSSSRGGGGMPRELVLNATFLDPMTGDVMRRTAIRWSLDRGRSPADFLTAA